MSHLPVVATHSNTYYGLSISILLGRPVTKALMLCSYPTYSVQWQLSNTAGGLRSDLLIFTRIALLEN